MQLFHYFGMIARYAAHSLFTEAVLPRELTGAGTRPMEHVEISHALALEW